MKARLFKINGNWFVIDPPKDLFYEQDIEDENYAKHYALSICGLDKIEDIGGKWQNNTWVEGEKVGKQFKIANIEYKLTDKEIACNKIFDSILGKNKNVAITTSQYDKIKELSQKDNLITCYMSNGFCVNHKYLVFGKLTKDNRIIYPQIKLK